jgi:hypothetical protein
VDPSVKVNENAFGGEPLGAAEFGLKTRRMAPTRVAVGWEEGDSRPTLGDAFTLLRNAMITDKMRGRGYKSLDLSRGNV